MVFVYTNNGEKYLLYKILYYFESVCNLQLFYCINRQMLIAKSTITFFEPFSNRKILLHLAIRYSKKAIVNRLKISDLKSG